MFLLVDFVIPSKDESLVEAYTQWRERADVKVCCDYGLHVAVTHWNEHVANEMETLAKEKGSSHRVPLAQIHLGHRCLGVNSFQVFMAHPDTCMLRDDELYQVFVKCRELGAVAMVHAENGLMIQELEKEVLKMGITGPEGYLLSRPEAVRICSELPYV